MSKNNYITHEGIVTGTEGNFLTVLLSPEVACQGCKAGGSCSLSGESTKMLKVPGVSDYHPGEKVIVAMKKSQGYSALLLGYVYPLVILMASLIICISLSINELLSGLISVAVLVPYYILLYVIRSHISTKFSFKIITNPEDEPYSDSDYNMS